LPDSQSLEKLGYTKDGDRQVIESVLNFSRMLLENCGNRSIYASSPYLSDLLNSTSLSLVASTLQIGTQLAQRYQASFKRMASPHRHANAALLANHYNIDLERVQQLAQPFARTMVSTEPVAPTTPVTPSSKGKEKAYFNTPTAAKTSTVYANDLVSIARSGSTPSNSPRGQKGAKPAKSLTEPHWNEWGNVRVTYYQSQPPPSLDQESTSSIIVDSSPPAPSTPTPIRRSSTLGQQHGQRTSRLSNIDDSPNSSARLNANASDDSPNQDRLKVVEIPNTRVTTTSVHDLLKEYSHDLPRDSQFELLTKLRVAHALTSSIETRRQMLTVRILAVTNLAYIHSEPVFIEKVLKQDSDEPRRLQLTYQLAELIHPPTEGNIGIPRSLQTIALAGLEALAQHQSKYNDVCTALNTSVNHGVLLYIVRKAVAEMSHDEPGEKLTEKDEWRNALFSLLSHVATLPRAGAEMVTAGLIPILVEVLTLRTSIAKRHYPRILNFLDAIVFNVREAFQILTNSDGLDAISDLIIHEVKYCSKIAENEEFQAERHSLVIDYQIPYFSQQALKWLFKFIHHMMTTAGGYNGNFDRLLRNLIDSSQLLASLKEIIGHSHLFGSTVWTNAVSILNDFINNEPTSFIVIAEAGLSRELLEAVTGKDLKLPADQKESQQNEESTNEESTNDASSPAPTDDDSIMSIIEDASPHPPTKEILNAPRQGPLAHGIMPSSEAITIIPQAFGAICLNTSGMRMFMASNALQSFFEIFESPKHVKCMDNEHNIPANLGATFDELVRHHPPLKNAIINAVLDMVARVSHLCDEMASKDKIGTKMWNVDETSQTVIPDGSVSNVDGKGKGTSPDTDVEMGGVSDEQPLGADSQTGAVSPEEMATPYIHAVSMFLSCIFNNSQVRLAFIEKGGIEYVLNLAETASLDYHFADNLASRALHSVICMLAEQKPHLVVPSLLKRAQSAADILAPVSSHNGPQPFFTAFVSDDLQTDIGNAGAKVEDGTRFVKALVNLHSLLSALHRCFQTPAYNHRTTTTFFNQINLADYYVQLVQSLGPLLAAATKEDFILQKSGLVPAHWKRATRWAGAAGHLRSGEQLEDVETERAINELVATDPISTGEQATASDAVPQSVTTSGATIELSNPDVAVITDTERKSARFKNFQMLRYLLSKMPPNISSFFQVLGKALTTNKRSPDMYQRQCYTTIADALAETVLDQLAPIETESDSTIANYTFWIVMLGTIKDMLIHGMLCPTTLRLNNY
jgi:E3 ubiquitin-protein ligase HUWE1